MNESYINIAHVQKSAQNRDDARHGHASQGRRRHHIFLRIYKNVEVEVILREVSEIPSPSSFLFLSFFFRLHARCQLRTDTDIATIMATRLTRLIATCHCQHHIQTAASLLSGSQPRTLCFSLRTSCLLPIVT